VGSIGSVGVSSFSRFANSEKLPVIGVLKSYSLVSELLVYRHLKIYHVLIGLAGFVIASHSPIIF
jgi:hypothetical protein